MISGWTIIGQVFSANAFKISTISDSLNKNLLLGACTEI